MKRLRWRIALVVFVLVVAATLVFRAEPKDDLAFLKPYIVSDKTTFRNNSDMADEARPYRMRRLIIRGKSHSDFEKMFVVEFSARPGWHYDRGSGMHGEFIWIAGDSQPMAENNQFSAVGGNPYRDTDELMVLYLHNLSTFETWMLRLKNIGRDPFE